MLFKQTLRRSIFAAACLLVSSFAFGQSSGTIGLGVKAGDPTGLSVKFYRPKVAIEVVLGRPYYFSGHYNDHGYYERRFDNYDKYKNGYYYFDGRRFDGYKIHGYKAYNPMALQVHFLMSKSTKAAKELKWYLGAGPQFRAHKVDYYYRDYYGTKNDHYVVRTDQYTNIDLGLDGVFGLEYTFSDLPVSIFGDINLFMELVDDINLELQGGLGVRYNLK